MNTANTANTAIAAFSEGRLDVGDGHRIFYAQYGCPNGRPAVVLHGGPGSGCNASMLEWFDLSQQRVVLFDQRGAGASEPRGELRNNTTQALVRDIECLRRHLGVATWLVVGGSWGAMLALAYAASHPGAVRAMVLRGVFLPGRQQLDWFFQTLQNLVPTAWHALTENMNSAEKKTVMATLSQRLLNGSQEEQLDAAGRWARYEDAVMALMSGNPEPHPAQPGSAQLEKYRLQAHYLIHDCFVDEGALLSSAGHLHMPVIFVHGALDLVCPSQNLERLMRYMRNAQARLIPRAGHTPGDPAIRAALKEAIFDIEREPYTA
jgi:proline iminopeptidase